jgi:hypothetical protein
VRGNEFLTLVALRTALLAKLLSAVPVRQAGGRQGEIWVKDAGRVMREKLRRLSFDGAYGERRD